MSYYDPPEDERVTCYSCAVCGRGIREHEEYYDFGALGIYCERCVSDAHRYEAEPNWDEEGR